MAGPSGRSRRENQRSLYHGAVRHAWPDQALCLTRLALVPLADDREAISMAAYMKDVAPFLGVRSPARRRAQRDAWQVLDTPTNDELGLACFALVAQREREYHYAASDLIATYLSSTDESFLVEYVADLLTTTSWWDTVDGLGSSAVSPLCWRYDASELVLTWSASSNLVAQPCRHPAPAWLEEEHRHFLRFIDL